MVTITNFAVRQRKDGTEFCLLEITGGVEFVESQKTGQFYATARKCMVPSTFPAVMCSSLIGEKLPGTIEKVECDPYKFTIQQTGEEVYLNHRYEYRTEKHNLATQVPEFA